MNILGFNPGHHGSACLLQDGEIKYFIQEERIGNRKKYCNYPFISFIDILQNYKIDYITWGTPSVFYSMSTNDTTPLWCHLAYSYNPIFSYKEYSDSHHLCHAAHAFYNSGFKECLGVVIDGLGSFIKDIDHETETIFKCSYPGDFRVIYKNTITQKRYINLSQIYETITMHLGWNRDEAGKTMGLSPYGKYNPNLPNLFKDNKGNSKVFYRSEEKNTYLSNQSSTFIDTEANPQLKLKTNPKKWHYDESKITNLEKDLAWKVQNDTQQLVGDYIEKAIKKTDLKQVCCSGGYFLNCVTNYYLQKRFPDIEFYFEPIANDAGTAVGAAKLLYHSLTKDTINRPFKSLYLGKQYSKDKLLEGMKKYI